MFLHVKPHPEMTDEQKRAIAEEYNAKKKEEDRKRHESLSTCGHVKEQQGATDIVYGSINLLVGESTEDGIYDDDDTDCVYCGDV